MKAVIPVTFCFFIFGCGASVLDAAQKTVVTAHRGVMEFDARFAPVYEAARIKAREESATREELEKRIAPWEAVRKNLVTTLLIIKTAALSISIAQDGYSSDWIKRTACVMEALTALEETIKSAGLTLPFQISEALKLGKPFIGPCKNDG